MGERGFQQKAEGFYLTVPSLRNKRGPSEELNVSEAGFRRGRGITRMTGASDACPSEPPAPL